MEEQDFYYRYQVSGVMVHAHCTTSPQESLSVKTFMLSISNNPKIIHVLIGRDLWWQRVNAIKWRNAIELATNTSIPSIPANF